jgi:hypothetical protein
MLTWPRSPAAGASSSGRHRSVSHALQVRHCFRLARTRFQMRWDVGDWVVKRLIALGVIELEEIWIFVRLEEVEKELLRARDRRLDMERNS